jgi:lipopolysaccharide/colanic/teichoic acid biosynthesis glycosyltransferase
LKSVIENPLILGSDKNLVGDSLVAHSTSYIRRINSFVTNLLVSNSRLTWYLCSLLISFGGFVAFSFLSPWPVDNVNGDVIVPAIIYSILFSSTALGIGLFDRSKRFNPLSIFQLGVNASAVAFSLALLVYFILYWRVGRYSFLFGSFGATIAPITFQLVLQLFLRANPYRFVCLGPKTPIMKEILNIFSTNKRFKPFQHLSELEGEIQQLKEPFKLNWLIASMRKEGVCAVILNEEIGSRPDLLELSLKFMQAGFRVTDEIAFYREVFERFPPNALSQQWLLLNGVGAQSPLHDLVKRLFDVTLAIVSIVLFSPLMLFIALCVKFTSDGPIIFSQERAGRYCKIFKIYKFRTMTQSKQEDDAGANSTQRNDVRVTATGKWLRPLHLDELPQLWNILRGEMSFVGPRPEVMNFHVKIKVQVPFYEFRYLTRPGLTGLAQINQGYTYHGSEDYVKDTMEKLSYDLYYLKNQNIFLDLLIILRTAFFLARESW